MPTNLENLETAMNVLANQITDDVDKYECLALIEQFIDALSAQATSTATDIQSYSIMGRQVTRRGGSDAMTTAGQLRMRINRLLYGIDVAPNFQGSDGISTI